MQNKIHEETVAHHQALIVTGRKPIPLMKHPQDLDFSKKIGNTTYVVKSHFERDSKEYVVAKISRLYRGNKNLSE